MSKLSLEVGKTYIDRTQHRVTIIAKLTVGEAQNLHPQKQAEGNYFKGDNDQLYKTDGRWGWNDVSRTPYDLISIDSDESETLGDILGAALKERDEKARDMAKRITSSHDEILAELGYIAAKGLTIRCVKIYRTIYGVDLGEAKTKIQEAAATARRLYHFG